MKLPMNVPAILTHLLKQSHQRKAPITTQLPCGLKVQAHPKLTRLSLWRDDKSWQPSNEAEAEGLKYADELGWPFCRVEWHKRQLVLTKVASVS